LRVHKRVKKKEKAKMTMRYLMKGGYWKNSEDEILKAAVMKYGLNQWSRISSLIARKSAKQCKARWYEWLDPSIKKTEWTREEEEKLLHLAKIFPSQWRTISPIVGRTPAQCVQHYERLLDQAQGRDEIDENDPRRLKPGEIDPTPEIRPARADAKDMDDDEKEMIAEARVRLANIKGKKAKRRAREKFIEKSRQLAQLQKQRELKAAGIEYIIEKKKKKKKVEIDYNAEIPFERRPIDEVFTTSMAEEPTPNPNIGNISLNTLEGVRRDEEEKNLRKLDQKRLKKLRTMKMPEHQEKLNKINPLMYQKKTRLILTEPQLTDRDLELLGKITKNAAETITSSSTAVTKELVGSYSIREPTPVRTPKYSSQLMKDAKHAYNLINAPSPMLGQEHLVQDDSQENGKKSSIYTPNPYKKMINDSTGSSRGETPLSVSNKSKLASKSVNPTLYNDEFNINNDEWTDNSWEEGNNYASSNGANPYDRIREIIRRNLEGLPEPKNDYEIDMPELSEFYRREKELIGKRHSSTMDLEDLEMIRMEALEQQKLKDFYKLSQVRQRGLPIPKKLPEAVLNKLNSIKANSTDPAELILKESIQLIVNDMVEKPDGKIDVGALVPLYRSDFQEEHDNDDLEKAEYLIAAEVEEIMKEKGVSREQVDNELVAKQLFDEEEPFSMTKEEEEFELLQLSDVKSKLEAVANKLENDISEADAKEYEVLEAQIALLQQKIDTKSIELEVFTKLKEQEDLGMINRLHEADVHIMKLKEREAQLQALYREYLIQTESIKTD
jgi:pre-mRNA-splicing factor CDC5/CEF1